MLSLGATFHAEAVFDDLDKLAGTPEEPELWRRLAMLQRQNERKRVERREGVDGETYPTSKRAERDGGYTLIDKGHMVNAMAVRGVTSFGSRLGFGSVFQAMKAGWHHFGTKRGVRRPFWGFAASDLEALNKYKTEFIEAAVTKLKVGRK